MIIPDSQKYNQYWHMKIEHVLKIVIRSKNLEIYEYKTKNLELFFHFFITCLSLLRMDSLQIVSNMYSNLLLNKSKCKINIQGVQKYWFHFIICHFLRIWLRLISCQNRIFGYRANLSSDKMFLEIWIRFKNQEIYKNNTISHANSLRLVWHC